MTDQQLRGAQDWINRNRLAEAERWLERRSFEMACPYIYPPVGRYAPLDRRKVYEPLLDGKRGLPSLYVHIPYCIRRCNFCNFALDVLRDSETAVEEYLRALDEEASSLPGRVRVGSVYVGGGTPSILNRTQLERFFDVLWRHFEPAPGAEVCMEVNPDTVQGHGREKLAFLVGTGVTRVSMGVQSMSDRVLTSLGRTHDRSMVGKAVDAAREAGVRHLNVDLMYSLPDLDPETWDETLSAAADLGPDSITLYELRISPDSPLNEHEGSRAVNAGRTPSQESRIQRAMAMLVLEERGYRRSMPNQYTLGREHDQLHYVEVRERLTDLIGLGLSAIGNVDEVVFKGETGLSTYMKDAREGQYRIRGVALRPSETRARAMVLGLKSPRGVSYEVFRERFGQDLRQVFGSTVDALVEQGLLEDSGTHLGTTDLGGFFIDRIVTLFFLPDDVQAVESHEVKHLGVYWH